MRWILFRIQGKDRFFFLVGGLSGCIGIGATRVDRLYQFFGPVFRRLDVVVKLFVAPFVKSTGIREAIEFHFEGMKQDGKEIPQPNNSVEYIEVAA